MTGRGLQGARGQSGVVLLVAAGILGGCLHAIKGAVLLSGGPDLSLVPAMIFFFGLGMLALHRSLSRPGGLARAGLVSAWATVAFGILSLACQAKGWQPEDPADPVIADVAYGGGTLAIFAGLLLLGLAWLRDDTIRQPWRLVPIVVAVLWFPLEALTAVLPDGWGLLLAGVTWVVAALSPVFASRQAMSGAAPP